MNVLKPMQGKWRSHRGQWIYLLIMGATFFILLSGQAFADKVTGKSWRGLTHHILMDNEEEEQQFGATSIIIETTDNDIELQIFVDGVRWKSLKIFSPEERKLFNLKTKNNLHYQGGLSELYFASEPTHYMEDEPNFDGTIEAFLSRFPAGEYEFEGRTLYGEEIEGEATLTHILPELPVIVKPLSDGDVHQILDPKNVVIEWEPVTTRFIGDGPVEIIEYQVIVDQDDPERNAPWVDGNNRRALINLPGSVTRLTVPPEFLLPNTSYAFEILAIEASGNTSISVGEFVTGE